MSFIQFPSSIPTPLASMTFSDLPTASINEYAGGPIIMRQFASSTRSRYELEYLLTASEFQQFKSFYRNDLQNGAIGASMLLNIDATLVLARGYIVNPVYRQNGPKWSVSCIFEGTDVAVNEFVLPPDEPEADVILALNGGYGVVVPEGTLAVEYFVYIEGPNVIPQRLVLDVDYFIIDREIWMYELYGANTEVICVKKDSFRSYAEEVLQSSGTAATDLPEVSLLFYRGTDSSNDDRPGILAQGTDVDTQEWRWQYQNGVPVSTFLFTVTGSFIPGAPEFHAVYESPRRQQALLAVPDGANVVEFASNVGKIEVFAIPTGPFDTTKLTYVRKRLVEGLGRDYLRQGANILLNNVLPNDSRLLILF